MEGGREAEIQGYSLINIYIYVHIQRESNMLMKTKILVETQSHN